MKTTVALLARALSACAIQSNLIPDKAGYALQMDGCNQGVTAGQSKQVEVNVLHFGVIGGHALVASLPSKGIIFKLTVN